MSETPMPASLTAWWNGALVASTRSLGQLLELGPAEAHQQVERALGRRGDERQVDLGLGDLGQFDLGLLGRLLEALDGHARLRTDRPRGRS